MADNANAPLAHDVYIESKLPADNGYGQNGYRGPSSDLPGKRTSTHFLPDCKIPADSESETKNWQTRSVSDKPYAVHPGMKSPAKASDKVPPSNRPVTQKFGK